MPRWFTSFQLRLNTVLSNIHANPAGIAVPSALFDQTRAFVPQLRWEPTKLQDVLGSHIHPRRFTSHAESFLPQGERGKDELGVDKQTDAAMLPRREHAMKARNCSGIQNSEVRIQKEQATNSLF